MKVPKKVLRYFPVIPRLQRLYNSSHTAKEMTWHATGKCTEPGKMQHPVDGRAWKNFDTNYPNFAKEPRNVQLGLAADGFNLFENLSQAYSIWPVILTTYNLPPWLCMKESSFMLTLFIPGPKSPSKDIDVYLRPLIDDLKVLWALKGVETIDVAIGQKFNMRAMVLWTINDFPARSSLSGWSGQGYKACPTCNEDTPSLRVLGKTAYVGHRRFLKKPYKWRRSLEFNGEIEDGDPPRKFDRDQIQAQLARLPTRVKGKHPSYGGVKIKLSVLVELNWTNRSIFYELEYWSFLTLKHNLDIMHIEKNMLEAILNTLLMNDKSKDTSKARQDLKRLGIRSGLWLGQTKNGKCSKPQAAYSLTPENRKKFCQFIKGVKLLDWFRSNFKHKVTDNDTNITGLKSHDCHIMMQCLLLYGLEQYLPDEVAKPIIELCSFFKQICTATLMEDDTLKAQSKVVDILCNLELIYPPAFFDIMIHLVILLELHKSICHS
ncbi:zinc finger, PHD-type containing protein [Tanacetum coccineum]|uniref:Zinc finger, PHD-type containing protein n=1 Tax=Tanacetum coccineum TaxID=301880 RepID=A0ABQ5HCG8_9ASTR